MASCAHPVSEAPLAAPVASAAAAAVEQIDEPAGAPAPASPHRIETARLPNAIQVTAGLISGGMPEGDEAFAELASLGVKTVISVDGARPDVARAEKFGLRYVHLPHGYDGVPTQRGLELAQAVRTLPRPIYLHCHHGKHRSPAAAAVACVVDGLLTREAAGDLLRLAGTSPSYRGLYQSVANAAPVEAAAFDALAVEFTSIAKLPPLAEAMVEIEHTFDRLKKLAAAEWRAPSDLPDVDPAHQALLLREHYTELLRGEAITEKPAEFRDLLARAEREAKELVDALGGGVASETGLHAASAAFARVTQTCTDCHRPFRDVPK